MLDDGYQPDGVVAEGGPSRSLILFIGDAGQLPSVGAGDVLRDMVGFSVLPCFRLSKIFRQAQESLIIRYAHQINNAELPAIDSPFREQVLWNQGADCLFLDSDEATRERLGFIARVKKHHDPETAGLDDELAASLNSRSSPP